MFFSLTFFIFLICWEGRVINDILILVLAPIFLIISFFYSSVGFAGGSSYIAILVLVGVNLYAVPPISLALNIIVSSSALFNYLRAGHLSLRLSIPLLISVPFAFIGGSIVLPEKILTFIFVISLFCASAALLLSGRKLTVQNEKMRKLNLDLTKTTLITCPLGALLGGISGLVGIGGGIWLSPILIMSGLANPKEAAASASLFILTNSISGFIAHYINNIKNIDFDLVMPLSVIVLFGGILGSRLGAFKFDHNKIIMIIGVLVALAAINLATKLF
ncbi:MAG TPA: sulfite exporter TauE/SafE family protein [Nitrososphaeraceae archaeon]|nr:sulfite exporter TauE/SafE family protein [Nitrososphaeraceae archaeon]